MMGNVGSSVGGFLVALLALAGCGGLGESSIREDAAGAAGDAVVVAETGPTQQTAPTLQTGVDQAALAAALTPQVAQIVRAIQPGADADTIQLGRPWGEFDVHKGPRLVFRGSWVMLASIDGSYFAIVTAIPDGSSYKVAAIGSAQFVPTMVELEQRPAVSAALDRGGAAFLRCAGDGGDSLLAYEAEAVTDAGQVEIRVEPLSSWDRRFSGIDASVDGIADVTLAELDPMLPAE